MPEKRESYQSGGSGAHQAGTLELPSQESIDLLTRLLQEFGRQSEDVSRTLPQEVERDIAIVTATFEVIEHLLSLKHLISLNQSPMSISTVTPNTGPVAGGDNVTIIGSHFVPGATVRFGNNIASDIEVVSLTEIRARTPPGSAGAVDIVIDSFVGSVTRGGGYTYA
jgi:hypothetical protein